MGDLLSGFPLASLSWVPGGKARKETRAAGGAVVGCTVTGGRAAYWGYGVAGGGVAGGRIVGVF